MDDMPRKMGRPRKLQNDDVTLRLLRSCGRIQCTTKEVASFFSVSEPTILKFLTDEPEARQAYDEGKDHGRLSLRRKQFRLADTNATMAIFLGKNILGQRDAMEVEHGGSIDFAYTGQRVRDKVAAILADGGEAPGPEVRRDLN